MSLSWPCPQTSLSHVPSHCWWSLDCLLIQWVMPQVSEDRHECLKTWSEPKKVRPRKRRCLWMSQLDQESSHQHPCAPNLTRKLCQQRILGCGCRRHRDAEEAQSTLENRRQIQEGQHLHPGLGLWMARRNRGDLVEPFGRQWPPCGRAVLGVVVAQ